MNGLSDLARGAWASAVIAAACAGERPDEPLALVRHTAAAVDTVRLDAAPRWQVSDSALCLSERAAEDQAVDALAGAVLLDSGVLVVPNPRTKEILLYRDLQVAPQVLGRVGSGPGEFRAISSVSRMPGDTGLVFDRSLQHVTAFMPGLGVVWNEAVRRPSAHDSAFIVRVGGVFADGALLLVATTSPQIKIGRSTSELIAYAWDRRNGVLHPLATGTFREMQVEPLGSSSEPVLLTPLFPRESLIAVSGLRLLITGTSSFQILSIDRSQADTALITFNRPGELVTPDRVEKAVGELRARLGDVSPIVLAKLRNRLPDTIPGIAAMIATTDGEVWVQPSLLAPQWLVLDAAGELLAVVEAPSMPNVTDIRGDTLVSIENTEHHVAVPCMRRITRARKDRP